MSTQQVVLAEYFTTDEKTLLFIVRADFEEPKIYEIVTPLEKVRQFVTTHFGTTEQGSQVRDLNLDEWQELFGAFIAPILTWAAAGDIVWLVPHDVLHYLPLHALKIEGRTLIERNPVCYTPSASVMKYCQAKRKGRRQQALILADSRSDLPLLHAREQAFAIQQLFAPNAELALNGAASKELVKQRLTEAREDIDILHFACHGYFDPNQALKSGVMLAPVHHTSLEDGPAMMQEIAHQSAWNLTAEDIFGLEIRADLVTLSACASGVNDHRPGDELIGLTRALIYAGTPSVVVSLWSVDEISTSILMRTFYQALKDGANKAEALQKAQVDLMKMTAQEIIAYCEAAKQHLLDPETTQTQRLLDWDIANVRFAARDFAGALDAYIKLQDQVSPSSSEYATARSAITRCNRALRSPKTVDYDRTLYNHPYYWAPFVLVGDWK